MIQQIKNREKGGTLGHEKVAVKIHRWFRTIANSTAAMRALSLGAAAVAGLILVYVIVLVLL